MGIVGIRRRFVVVTSTVLAALSLGVVSCGSASGRSAGGSGDADIHASTTSATPLATTPPRPDLVAALAQPGTHKLPLPPIQSYRADHLTFQQAGDQVLAWGATRFSGPDNGEADWDPVDEGALLDPRTLSWAKLPAPPFAHPTLSPQLAWTAQRVVLVGNSCDPAGAQTMDSLPPGCGVGSLQAAAYNPASHGWTSLSVPASIQGFVQYALVVGDRVLVVLGNEQSGEKSFGLLDPIKRLWTDVRAPVSGAPEVVCASDGTAFAINTQVLVNGVWGDQDAAGSGGNDGYGRVQVSSLGPSASAWSTPGPVGLASGAPLAISGCVGGGVVLIGDNGASPHHGQTGAWFWQPGGAWTSVPGPPPDLGQLGEGGLALNPLDRDRVGLVGQNNIQGIFDGTTHTWTSEPFSPAGSVGPVIAHIGRSELSRDPLDGGLVAITP